MSYEGYEQLLCENHHYRTINCYEGIIGVRCAKSIDGKPCGAKFIVTNSVDETNCDAQGYKKPIELTPAVVETCSLGTFHELSAATYKLSDEIYSYDQDSQDWVRRLIP